MTASTVAVYDAIAASYAARRAEMPPRLVQLAQRALAIVRRSGADPIAIADLGCGAGRDLAFFEREQPSAVTVGIDASAAMLEAARPHVHGRLVEGDLRLLPLEAGSQHLVWACASLLHLPKQQLPAALSEARRVLAPGGVLAVTMKAGTSEGFEPNTQRDLGRAPLLRPLRRRRARGRAGGGRVLPGHRLAAGRRRARRDLAARACEGP